MSTPRRAFLGMLAGLAVTPAAASRLLPERTFLDAWRAAGLDRILCRLPQAGGLPNSGGFLVSPEFVEELRRHYALSLDEAVERFNR